MEHNNCGKGPVYERLELVTYFFINVYMFCAIIRLCKDCEMSRWLQKTDWRLGRRSSNLRRPRFVRMLIVAK